MAPPDADNDADEADTATNDGDRKPANAKAEALPQAPILTIREPPRTPTRTSSSGGGDGAPQLVASPALPVRPSALAGPPPATVVPPTLPARASGPPAAGAHTSPL